MKYTRLMQGVYFLKDDGALALQTKEAIETLLKQCLTKALPLLRCQECAIVFITNTDKVPSGAWFHTLPGEGDAVYMFISTGINEGIQNTPDAVEENLYDTLLGGLYTVCRARSIGLSAECGVLEEIIDSGFATHFVREQGSKKARALEPAELTTEQTKRLTLLLKQECEKGNTNVEKWFFGSEEEAIPPQAGRTLGTLLVGKYLQEHKCSSRVGLTTRAKDMALW